MYAGRDLYYVDDRTVSGLPGKIKKKIGLWPDYSQDE